jgi:hypothetical protein
MTIANAITAQFHNMSFKASKKKISTLLKQKTEEITKAIDVIQDITERHLTNHALHSNFAQPTIKKGKTFLDKAIETSKIGFAGIFFGVFCILFSLIYTMICYANKRE